MQSELGVVTYSYDSFGKLIEILQNNKAVRSYSYDNFNRVATMKDYSKPGSSSYILKSYEYDSFGRCVERFEIKYCIDESSNVKNSFDLN